MDASFDLEAFSMCIGGGQNGPICVSFGCHGKFQYGRLFKVAKFGNIHFCCHQDPRVSDIYRLLTPQKK